LFFSTKTERRILWNIKEWKKERGKATGKGRKKRKNKGNGNSVEGTKNGRRLSMMLA